MSVLLSLTNYIESTQRKNTVLFYLVLKESMRDQFSNLKNIKIILINNLLANGFVRIFSDRLLFMWIEKEYSFDLIFSVGNVAIPNPKPQCVIFMQPWLIYPDAEDAWCRLGKITALLYRLRMKVIRNRLKYATQIFAQTEVAKERLIKHCQIDRQKVTVIPMAPPILNQYCDKIKNNYSYLSRRDVKNILVLTKYYSHKNIEILIPLAKKIQANNLRIRLILTIDPSDCKAAYYLLDDIQRFGLGEIILNVGTVPHREVRDLFQIADAMLLPTLLESYSSNYSDSLKYGVPIFTSDRDFARSVCGDCAIYFDPVDVVSIYNSIEQNIFRSERLKEMIKNGKKLLVKRITWSEISELYVSGCLVVIYRYEQSKSDSFSCLKWRLW